MASKNSKSDRLHFMSLANLSKVFYCALMWPLEDLTFPKSTGLFNMTRLLTFENIYTELEELAEAQTPQEKHYCF